ncbi:MAG: hypothetical protein J6B83_01190 [Bacteroidaceae bacterium]|nr:hypothetical protein [Bacteroidaceae bacterium]
MMKGILVILMLVGALLEITAAAPAGFLHKTERTQKQDTTIRVIQRDGDRSVSRKMSHSAYPVQMSMVGNAVRVESPENQILPIYTHTGTFYLIVRLNKGTNWLNGLPKGRYFINNRLIAIK